jgi:hypothetical protein
VSRDRPNGRALKKARTGAKARSYAEAVAVLERAAEPISGDVVAGLCDAHTRRQHGLVLKLLDRLERRPGGAAPCRIEHSTVQAGPMRYLPRHRSDDGRLYGVLLGDLLVDVPGVGGHGVGAVDPVHEEAALAARSGGRPALVVHDDRDLERAIYLSGLA